MLGDFDTLGSAEHRVISDDLGVKLDYDVYSLREGNELLRKRAEAALRGPRNNRCVNQRFDSA